MGDADLTRCRQLLHFSSAVVAIKRGGLEGSPAGGRLIPGGASSAGLVRFPAAGGDVGGLVGAIRGASAVRGIHAL